MRVLFIQQDHMSPTGPVGEAFGDELEFLRRAHQAGVPGFLALGETT